MPDFFAWLEANRLWIVTNPDIKDYDFVQVESLLCAVERVAGEITDAEAQEIVDADPSLAADRMAKDAPRWLVGADAHRKWRVKLTQAVSDGELFLLDFGSKLPIALPAAAALAAVQYGWLPVETKPQAAPAKPLQRSAAQEAEILSAIKQAGHDPLALPENESGKDGVKSEIRNALDGTPLFVGPTVFKKAWERLRGRGEIATRPRRVSP